MSLYEQAVSLAGQHGICLIQSESCPTGTVVLIMEDGTVEDINGDLLLAPAVYIHPMEAEHGRCR